MSWSFTHRSPSFIMARTAVGAVYRMFTPNFSTISQNRSGLGKLGTPSNMSDVVPFDSGPYTRYECPVIQPASAVHQKMSFSLRSKTYFDVRVAYSR